MTESRTDALMAHASEVLRNAPEPGWDRISDKVIRALRSTSATGWPLNAHASEGPRLGTVSVSDHVLRAHLAAEIRSRHHCSPSIIEFFVDGHEIRSLRIELAAPYGVDLAELSDRVRFTVVDVVHMILGNMEPPVTAESVHIAMTDIVEDLPAEQNIKSRSEH
ncbi:hypothetical protein QM716_20945 [Rhodococcus sp. IEGM 1409]|uniref:hypothetical protein n=1 Tax=Rhodococcus sp. IEGM 1409 TaxID=3047082 RepID=UPI0024B6B17F|nr:hypothetical protein [Rhodococcus sp. IEGM 1409]MDI9902328.1 hypothetical protein [Rhodococcus sp. IEGM 1409]